MSMTVREVEELVVIAAVKIVAAGAKAKATPGSWFTQIDDYSGQVSYRARPLILQRIADDEEKFDDLRDMTENRVDAAKFSLAILDCALQYAVPLLERL